MLLSPSFDIRMNADGTVNKYKARLVAQGNHQDNLTFCDTFVDIASVRTINILWEFLPLISKLLFYISHERNYISQTSFGFFSEHHVSFGKTK